MPTKERAVVNESAKGTVELVKVVRNQYSTPHAINVMKDQAMAKRKGKCVMARSLPLVSWHSFGRTQWMKPYTVIAR